MKPLSFASNHSFSRQPLCHRSRSLASATKAFVHKFLLFMMMMKFFSQQAEIAEWNYGLICSHGAILPHSLVQRFRKLGGKGFVLILTSSVMLRGWSQTNSADHGRQHLPNKGAVHYHKLYKESVRSIQFVNESPPEWAFCVLIAGKPASSTFALRSIQTHS